MCYAPAQFHYLAVKGAPNVWHKDHFQPKSCGLIFVIAAPSGGGKSSTVKALIEEFDGLIPSVSHTTRDRRAYEMDGREYHFVSKASFDTLKADKQFVEVANVFGTHWYGTSKGAIDDAISTGQDVLLDIDWQGARAIKQLYPKRTSTIFLLPPSHDELLKRLRQRGRDNEVTIQARMSEAEAEMSHCHEFDYLVINDHFKDTLSQIKQIIVAERSRYERQADNYRDLLVTLIGGIKEEE